MLDIIIGLVMIVGVGSMCYAVLKGMHFSDDMEVAKN